MNIRPSEASLLRTVRMALVESMPDAMPAFRKGLIRAHGGRR